MHISRGTQRLSRRKALLVWALVVLAVHLHASEGVEAVPAVSLTSSDTVAPLSKTQTVKVLLHHGWKACRFGSTGSTRYSSSGRTATSSSSSTNAWRYPSQGCGNSASAGSTTCTSEVCSDATNDTSLPRLLHVSRLPTTALTVLLENGLINVTTTNKDLQNSATGTMEDRLYFGTNLAQIPDISQVGRAFYTLLYQYDFDFSRYPHPNNFYSDIDRSSTAGNTTASTTKSTAVTRKRHILRLAGVNYRAVAWLDGKLCPELQVPQFSQYRHQEENTNNHSNKHSGDEDFAPGMFRRRAYDVTGGGRFVLLVEPPDHPGIPIQPQQQGGNHDLARDGAVPQYMLGWDWCQAMPDRATGFYGSVVLETTTTISTMSSPSSLPDGDNDEDDDADPWSLLDVAIQTIGLRNCSWFNDPPTQRYGCDKVMLRILARAEGSVPAFTMERGRSTASKQMTASLIVQSDWGESWTIPIANNHTTNDNQSNENNKFINDEKDLVQVEIMVRDNPRDNVHLWWPHGVLRGLRVAHRHQFTVSLIVNNRVTDVHTIHTGIRSVSTWLDEDLQGQRFRINGQNVYLVGGNWIGTDQALRTSASTRRYCSEIALHRYAGLNLIRVWGGGTAERDDFYQCADRLGILVWQEFWMTGDNNGRWAGNYNWPENHSAYLYHIRDTVQRLRGYASLLFYSGCNECLAPKGANDAYPNPPRSIDDGIRTILNDFDPGRFYISSSMGGANVGDRFVDPTLYRNRSYSLAGADGPYSMLYPTTFFNRNPGLPIHNISVGFQPEIGSVGSPTYKGLLKFLSASDIESGYPRRGADTSTNEVWQFHKFQPWTTQCTDNPIYDHVYSYFKLDQSVSAKDWAAAAQLAAHVQYQALFNGFIRFMFTYTTAVLMWKSQSPWPSLRGFLYDWYLESTGTLRGVRAALLSPVSVVYDPQTSQLYLLNRQVISLHSNATRPIGARFSWIDIHGTTVLSGEVFSSMDSPAMSVSRIGHNDKDRLRWPKNCTAVCFMKLQLLDDGALDNQPTTWHWLTNPDLGEMSDFSELGNLRKRQDVAVELNVLSCVVEADGIRSNVTIYVHSNSSDVLFYPTFSIESVATGRQMLPLFDVDETDVVVTPGIGQQRQLRTLTKLDSGEFIRIVLTSWNAPEIIREVGCYAPLVEEL